MPARRPRTASRSAPPSNLPGVQEARRRRRGGKSRKRRGRRRSRSRSRSMSDTEGARGSGGTSGPHSHQQHAEEASSRGRSSAASSRSQSMESERASTPARYTRRSCHIGNINPYINFVASTKGHYHGRPINAIGNDLAARWRALSATEREPYILQARRSKAEIAKALKTASEGASGLVHFKNSRTTRVEQGGNSLKSAFEGTSHFVPIRVSNICVNRDATGSGGGFGHPGVFQPVCLEGSLSSVANNSAVTTTSVGIGKLTTPNFFRKSSGLLLTEIAYNRVTGFGTGTKNFKGADECASGGDSWAVPVMVASSAAGVEVKTGLESRAEARPATRGVTESDQSPSWADWSEVQAKAGGVSTAEAGAGAGAGPWGAKKLPPKAVFGPGLTLGESGKVIGATADAGVEIDGGEALMRTPEEVAWLFLKRVANAREAGITASMAMSRWRWRPRRPVHWRQHRPRPCRKPHVRSIKRPPKSDQEIAKWRVTPPGVRLCTHPPYQPAEPSWFKTLMIPAIMYTGAIMCVSLVAIIFFWIPRDWLFERRQQQVKIRSGYGRYHLEE